MRVRRVKPGNKLTHATININATVNPEIQLVTIANPVNLAALGDGHSILPSSRVIADSKAGRAKTDWSPRRTQSRSLNVNEPL